MEKNELLRELNELCCPLGIFSKCYMQKIYDPKQDFAMYGLTESTVNSAKAMLKKRGGQYFRVVKNRGYVAFEVGEVRNAKINLDEVVVPLGLSVGFKCKGIIINRQKFTKTSNICYEFTTNI